MAKELTKAFENLDLIDETLSLKDHLKFTEEKNRISTKIQRLIKKNQHRMIAYLGSSGIGKSSLLEQIHTETSYNWVTFEPWRYSDRNDLWDAFVIKFISNISNTEESAVADAIDGQIDDFDFIKFFGLSTFLIFVSLTFAGLIWTLFNYFNIPFEEFWKDYFKYCIPIVAAIILGTYFKEIINLNSRFKFKPLKRVIELENMLLENVHSVSEPIIVVVEDIDRTKEEGEIFLETLSLFLKKTLVKSIPDASPIIVIAPQSTETFDRFDVKYQGLESALKIYDESISFNSPISKSGLNSYVSELKPHNADLTLFVEAVWEIIEKHNSYINIRLLKYALREVQDFEEIHKNINTLLALVFVLSRFIPVPVGNDRRHLASHIIKRNSGSTSDNTHIREFYLSLGKSMTNYNEFKDSLEEIKRFKINSSEELDSFTAEVITNIRPTLHINIPEHYLELLH